jgi:hypothetical protein
LIRRQKDLIVGAWVDISSAATISFTSQPNKVIIKQNSSLIHNIHSQVQSKTKYNIERMNHIHIASMNDWSVAVRIFRGFLNRGLSERAVRHIQWSFDGCLDLATPSFFHEMVEAGHSLIINMVTYILLQQGLDVSSLLHPSDFLLACQRCDAPVIALYHNCLTQPPTPCSKSITPGLAHVLDRDDPSLLVQLLKIDPTFTSSEVNPIRVLKYVLDNPKTHKFLLDELWILVDHLKLSESTLVCHAIRWNRRFPDLQMPYELHMANAIAEALNATHIAAARSHENVVAADDVADLSCPDAMSTMARAGDFFQWLNEMVLPYGDTYSAWLRFDAQSPIVLVQLPYALLTDGQLLLSREIRLERALMGQEAQGEGPFNDLINQYFRQLVASRLFAGGAAHDNTQRAILPTCIDWEGAEEREVLTLAYGLGVVLLKVLIDRRTIGGANQNNVAAFVPHPWFLRVLTDPPITAEATNPSTQVLFNESQLEDIGFYHRIREELLTHPGRTEHLRSRILEGKMHLGLRQQIFQHVHDGFNLVFVDGLTPPQAEPIMAMAREKLTAFYDKVKEVGPNALRLLVVPPTQMSPGFVLSRFNVVGYEHFGTGEDDPDCPIGADKEMLVNQSRKCFEEAIHIWCSEPCQPTLRRFLKFLTGSPVLIPIQAAELWEIAVDFSLVRSRVMIVHNCDRTVRIGQCSSAGDFIEIACESITAHELDPISRDRNDVSRATDLL